MGQAYGFFEIPSVTAAVVAVDIMCKTAEVEMVTWEKKLGGRLVTIIIRGDVSTVTQAIETAAKNGIKKTGGVCCDTKSSRRSVETCEQQRKPDCITEGSDHGRGEEADRHRKERRLFQSSRCGEEKHGKSCIRKENNNRKSAGKDGSESEKNRETDGAGGRDDSDSKGGKKNVTGSIGNG